MQYSIVIGAMLIACSRLCAQTLQPASTVKHGEERVEIFVGGNVKDVLGQTETPASISGNLGMRYRGHIYVATGLINIAARGDTVKEGFGGTLLQPAIGKGLNAALLDIRSPRLELWRGCDDNATAIRCHIGWHGYVSASSTLWGKKGLDTAFTVPVWEQGIDLSYSFVNGAMNDSNSVAMILDFGPTSRHLRGDLSTRDSTRALFLGSRQRNFYGIEAGLTLQYNLLTAGFTYYWLNGGVDGLSKGQIVAGVSLQTNLNAGVYKAAGLFRRARPARRRVGATYRVSEGPLLPMMN